MEMERIIKKNGNRYDDKLEAIDIKRAKKGGERGMKGRNKEQADKQKQEGRRVREGGSTTEKSTKKDKRSHSEYKDGPRRR